MGNFICSQDANNHIGIYNDWNEKRKPLRMMGFNDIEQTKN